MLTAITAWLCARDDVKNLLPVLFGIAGDVLIVYYAVSGYAGRPL